MKLRTICFVLACSSPLTVLAQISNFDSLNGYSAGLENRLINTRDRMMDDIRVSDQTRYHFSYRYVDREIDPVTERIRREMDGSGARLGMDWSFGDWALGLDIDYDRVSTDYLELNSPSPIPTSGTIKSRGYQLAANLRGASGNFRYGVGAGWGKTDHDGTRQSDIGLSSADYDSDEYFGFIRVEYLFILTDGVVIAPFAGISSMRVKADGFEESGTAADRRIVSDFSTRETLGTIGIRYDGEWGRVRPSLTLAWIEALDSNDFELGISASNGTPLGVGIVEAPYSGLFHIGAGLRIDLGNDWSLTPSARYQTGGDESAWNVQVGIAYGF